MFYHTRTGWYRETSLSPPVKIFFTDRSKVVLLMWVIFVIYVSCLSCFLVFSLQPCGHLLGRGLPLGSLVCYVLLCFVTFPCCVMGQVWYLPVLIPDLCLLTHFICFTKHVPKGAFNKKILPGSNVKKSQISYPTQILHM